MYQVRSPILGALTNQQLQQALNKAIVDEATAAEFYTRLLKEAPNTLHYEFIENAREEELNHLNNFEKLYYSLYGCKPTYKTDYIQYPNYKEGLLMALKSELEAADFYRDVQLSVKNPVVRDTFYYAMVDELEHATQFSTLYNNF